MTAGTAEGTPGADEDVGGLQVTVDDSPLVGVTHRVGDGREQTETECQLVARERRAARLQVHVKRCSAHEFHCKVVLAVIGTARLVNGGDVRVLEAPECLGFAHEHPDLGVVSESTADDLQGHPAPRGRLLGFEDDAHAAFSETTDEAVLTDGALGRARC